jgi:hypothetical protein
MTWTRQETVKVRGKVEFSLPELTVGEIVEIQIGRQETSAEPRRFGVCHSEKFHMDDDFDLPLEVRRSVSA